MEACNCSVCASNRPVFLAWKACSLSLYALCLATSGASALWRPHSLQACSMVRCYCTNGDALHGMHAKLSSTPICMQNDANACAPAKHVLEGVPLLGLAPGLVCLPGDAGGKACCADERFHVLRQQHGAVDQHQCALLLHYVSAHSAIDNRAPRTD